MSGPGGSVTKRDQRRESRKAQLQQRQLERQRERQRQIRQQQIRRALSIAVPILLIILIGVIVFATTRGDSTPSSGGLAPAHGQTVDGLSCLGSEGSVIHNHAYLEMYVNGEAVTLPPGVGIVAPAGTTALASNGLQTCLYPLHVHDQEPNIIHIESPVQKSYYLGELFDIWGQNLNSAQFLTNTIDATHTLKVIVFDANGNQTVVTTDPRQIELTAHETIAILYNSPNVTPKAYTDWEGL